MAKPKEKAKDCTKQESQPESSWVGLVGVAASMKSKS